MFHEWLSTFRKDLKESYGLEVTCEITDSREFSPFLEVQYKFIEGSVITNVYEKPTDAHSYLNYNSCHPRHVFRSIVYSQALRYRRIINDNGLLEDALKDLAGYFTQCGYPSELIDPILSAVLESPRSL